MPTARLFPWHVVGGLWKRRGQVQPPPSAFPEFAPGAVKPVGYYDELAGAGTRNVGPRTPTTPYNGNVTLNQGQTISGLEIFGRINIAGQGIIRDCIIHGAVASSGKPGPFPNRTSDPLPAADTGIILGSSTYNLQGSLIEFCRLDAIGFESAWQEGLRGGNYNCRYSEIYGAVDGVGMVQVGNGIIHCCRISRGYYTAFRDTATGNPLPGFPTDQSDRTTHSDGIQVHQFGGWVIRGSNIGGSRSDVDGPTRLANRDPKIPAQLAIIERVDAGWEYTNAAVIINSASPSSPTGVLIDNNWFEGGAASVNIGAKSTDPMVNTHVRNNRFIRTVTNPGFVIYRSTYHTGTVTGNVYDDTGSAVPINTFTPAG